jgi:hypothetical protein
MAAHDASALAMISERGEWPADWPEALEPYRSKAATIGVATGTQEDIYEIGFETRDEFEPIWHILCGLKSRNGTVTLFSPSSSDARTVFVRTGKTAVVRIRSHTRGGAASKPGGPKLTPCPPWPDSAYLPDGTLPEYVTISEDGQTWVPVNSPNASKGFHHRARVDLELIVDGQIIDLNRLRLPADTRIIDKRDLPGPAGKLPTTQPAEADSKPPASQPAQNDTKPPLGYATQATLPALAGRADLPTVAMYVDHSYAMRMPEDPPPNGPQVIFAAWNDGHIVWSDDPLNGGAPCHEGRFDPDRLQQLLTRMERQEAFTDLTLNYHHWGPDASFTALIVADSAHDRWLNMCSWHELHERKPTVVVTEHGAEALEGRGRSDVLANLPDAEKRYRQIWSQLRAGLNDLVPPQTTDPEKDKKELRFEYHTLTRDTK